MRMLSVPAVRPFHDRRSARLTRYRRAIAVRLSPERTTWCVRVVPEALVVGAGSDAVDTGFVDAADDGVGCVAVVGAAGVAA
jgi:hypothetical protein